MSNHLLLVLRLNPELSTATSVSPSPHLKGNESRERSDIGEWHLCHASRDYVVTRQAGVTLSRCPMKALVLRYASIPSYDRLVNTFMKRQIATTFGPQLGRPTEFRSPGGLRPFHHPYDEQGYEVVKIPIHPVGKPRRDLPFRLPPTKYRWNNFK
jgi:hypothetical protein